MCVSLITHYGAVRSSIQIRTNERTFFVPQLKCLPLPNRLCPQHAPAHVNVQRKKEEQKRKTKDPSSRKRTVEGKLRHAVV